MTKLNGIELKGNETFDEVLRIGKKKKDNSKRCPTAFKGRPKKDNSKKGDIFLNCRCCGVLISPDWYSRIDQRYCQDCL